MDKKLREELERLRRQVAELEAESCNVSGALRLSEARFSKIFRSSPDWIAISTFEDGRFIDVNDAFLRMTGYRREEVIGRTSDEIELWVNPEERLRMLEVLDEQREITGHEVKFRMKSGEIRIMMRSAEVVDLDGERYIINITRDITERKQAEEEIRKLNSELEQRVNELMEANRELDAFSHTVSHDLKSPLMLIGGLARRLLKASGEADKEALGAIVANVKRMEGLIHDLLVFSRSGRQQLKKEDVDVEGQVRSVFEDLRSLVPERDIRLELGKLLPAYADPSMLRQVFVNLLSNAIKFTRRRETAVIEVDCRKEGDGVLYYVKDNGTGFDSRHAEKLFDVFQRGHGAKEFEGTGIGLSIVQRIVVRHGGRVWAESQQGKGAIFYFTLPAKEH
ncbi:MAG TPA: ATP-binding protein [Dissulfurispiraceae bacterium]